MLKNKKLWLILIVVVVAALIIGGRLLYRRSLEKAGIDLRVETENVKIDEKKQNKCEDLGGYFEAIHNECSNVSAEQCQQLGGEFVECGSACRHNPTATACTMQCITYCQL
ncbi:MAG: hypothetical protein Q4G02_01895 [bacterium]|nr:hypothetical protein [bacterium]